MYTPLGVLLGSGPPTPTQLDMHIRVLGLEGQSASTLSGLEVACEARCGRRATVAAKPDGPKISTTFVASHTGTAGVQLAPVPGAPRLVFNLPDLHTYSELWCRVKLWEKRPQKIAMLGRGGTFLGETCFAVPRTAAGDANALCSGPASLSLRIEAMWGNLDRRAVVRIADYLGHRLLDAASRKVWHEVHMLSQLVVDGGWGDASADQCRSLAVGKVDSEGRTALHLCVMGTPQGQPQTRSAKHPAVSAASLLIQGRASLDVVAQDGDSPLTIGLRAGEPLTSLLAQKVQPALATAACLGSSPPGVHGRVDWDALRKARAFGVILFIAEQQKRAAQAPQAGNEQAKSTALRDTLCHAVSRHSPAMSTRVLQVMPPLASRASSADVLLLEQMLRLATKESGDDRWFGVAEAQLHRGAAVQAWKGGQRVMRVLADLTGKGQERARLMLTEMALGPERGRSSDEPRVLFPERAAECAVCFEPLYQNTPAYFLDAANRRSCVHYVCGGCAATCLSTKECPMCRATVDQCAALPSLEVDPRGWFAAAACGHGRLEPSELCHAVAACLPVSEERLLSAIESRDGAWRQRWSRDSDGTISEEDFFAPDTGLFAWILAHLRELHRNEQRRSKSAPDLREDPAAWFDFWDDQGSGTLTYGEVLRGIFVSHRFSALEDRGVLHRMRTDAAETWRAAGLRAESVTKAEFLRPDGLAARLGVSFEHAGVPAGAVDIAALPSAPQSPVLVAASPARPASSAQSLASLGPSFNPQLEADAPAGLAALQAMGFPAIAATEALHATGGDVEQAVTLLLSS